MMSILEDIKEELNIPQQEAVTQIDKPLLVLSGAGTGKTRTISYKIAYLVLEKQVDLNRILALTFTNKAAKEMRTRTLELLRRYMDISEKSEKQSYIGTFHANCIKILRWHGKILGYTSQFSIIDDDDQLGIIKRIVKENLLKYVNKPTDVRKSLSRLKNDFLTPQEVFTLAEKTNNLFLKDVAFVYEKYQEELLRANAMDFDDIQLNVIHLFHKDREVQHFWQNQFQAILVDEFQDTNKVQFLLLKMLMGDKGKNITFVGDDDQSIYSFRGAHIGNILNLSQDFPDLEILRLEENYRSTAPILNLANHTIAYNDNRLGKKLFAHNQEQKELPTLYIAQTDEQEAQFCIDTILKIRQPDQTAAIIYRTNNQSKIFERELVRQGIPYTLLGGRKFYEKKEVKDILAYFRILSNPQDNLAILRIINIPSRGVGDTSKEKLLNYARENNKTLYSVLESPPKEIRLTQYAQEQIKQWLLVLKDLKQTLLKTPQDILKILIESIEYKNYLVEYDKDVAKTEDRFFSLAELDRAYRKYLDMGGTFEAFVESVALMDSSDTHEGNSIQEENSPGIILTSVHGCKGLEFDYVFVVGLVEEIFPHYLSIETKEQLEEERRLFYVAVTRAKKGLFLISPARMYVRGQHEFFYQSRFIQEIPEALMQISRDSLSRIKEKWYKDLL